MKKIILIFQIVLGLSLVAIAAILGLYVGYLANKGLDGEIYKLVLSTGMRFKNTN